MNKMKVVKVLFGLLIGILSYAGSVCAEGFLTLPIESNVEPNCGFGCYPGHLGTDYPVPEGSYIVAPCDADVESIQDNVPHYDFDSGIKSFGNHIKLNAGVINGHQVKIVLAHLLSSSFFVGLNSHVTRGQRLALSDNSGTTTGPHLDMTVYSDGVAVNPYDSANWLWTTNPPSHAPSLVGKYPDSTLNQHILTSYTANGGSGRFGTPWNNSSFGAYVHPWPDNPSDPNVVWLQDFIELDGHWWQIVDNPAAGQAFPVHGQILTFWHANYGYTNYGAPKSNEYYATHESNGHQLVVQTFVKGSTVHYLGYDTVAETSKEGRKRNI
jgi:hypothetical protein